MSYTDTDHTLMLIRQWAQERNLIEGSDPMAQFDKLLEEVAELHTGLRNAHRVVVEGDNKNGAHLFQQYIGTDEVKDALGDIVVVLTILAAQCELSLADCIEHAYNQIKDRKGKMVNGVFVREE